MIHQYKNNGYNIVLDVNSGMVHVVDDLAYDIIEMYEKHSKDDIIAAMIEKYTQPQYKKLIQTEEHTEEDSADDIETLLQQIKEVLEDVAQMKKDGSLFTEDIYENYIKDFKQRSTVVKALCLHIAHDCNLACQYCFAGKGEYHGDRSLMSYEVGKQALDSLAVNR